MTSTPGPKPTVLQIEPVDLMEGDWALHKSGKLDPRQVVKVDLVHWLIEIDIFGHHIEVPMENYTYTRVFD